LNGKTGAILWENRSDATEQENHAFSWNQVKSKTGGDPRVGKMGRDKQFNLDERSPHQTKPLKEKTEGKNASATPRQ